MTKPKVAVLMPVCNAEQYLNQAIESILSQSFGDFEFVIVENGSTDRTWEIISSYNDHRIKAFQTNIKQITFNLNFGLMKTQAEYIARMDADDISLTERLQYQVDYLDSHNNISVLGTAIEIFGQVKKEKTITLPLTNRQIRRRLPFRFSICHPSVMVRRKVLLDCAGYNNCSHSEDIDLWIRLSADKNLRFANTEQVLLKYRIHPNQAKGRRDGYIGTASMLFGESMKQRSFRLFGGFLFSVFKMMFLRSK